MRTRVLSTALFLPLLALAVPVAAQAVPNLVPVGAVVRVSSPAYSGVATVSAARADSLHVVLEGLTAPVSIPTASITRLERRRPASALERLSRGAMWGAGVMGVLGLAMAASVSDEDLAEAGEEVMTRSEFVVYSAAGGALWGSVIGLVIPQHRWQPVR